MGGDGHPKNIPDGVESKGKGKGRNVEQSDAGRGDAVSGGLLTNILQNARSSVTPSNLASLMSANGKAMSSSTTQTAEQAHNIPSAPSLQYNINGARLPAADRKGQLGGPGLQQAEKAFRRFGSSEVDALARADSPALIGPYSSSDALDVALHKQVQAETSQLKAMDSAWMEPWQSISTTQPTTSLNEVWMRRAAGQPAQGMLDDGQRGERLDALLQTVGLSDATSSSAHGPPSPGVATSNDIFALIDEEQRASGSSNFDPQDVGLDDEQRNMHQRLDALQSSEARANEIIRPPDDDPVAGTGVYAATPEEALQAIWNGELEGQRASATVRSNNDSAKSLSGRIRELLTRGSYVDDVYGLPPQLEKTIVAAEEEETEENKSRKATAIRRLEALYRHLGANLSRSQFSIDDYIQQW